jgi:hypothetical protein
MLRDLSVPHQIILTKIDRLLDDDPHKTRRSNEDLAPLHKVIDVVRKQLREKQLTPLGDILCTSSKTPSLFLAEGRLGIAGVRAACVAAAGLEQPSSSRRVRRVIAKDMDGIEILENR